MLRIFHHLLAHQDMGSRLAAKQVEFYQAWTRRQIRKLLLFRPPRVVDLLLLLPPVADSLHYLGKLLPAVTNSFFMRNKKIGSDEGSSGTNENHEKIGNYNLYSQHVTTTSDRFSVDTSGHVPGVVPLLQADFWTFWQRCFLEIGLASSRGPGHGRSCSSSSFVPSSTSCLTTSCTFTARDLMLILVA
ncbi:unnamed protein product, partial [Amoebophrya sp. A120]|eukprot:GSA120T00012602001.1